MIDIENHILADVDYGGRGANLAVTLWIDEKARKAHLLCETETSFSNLPKPPQGVPVFNPPFTFLNFPSMSFANSCKTS
jgi:hypothetical protein